MKNVNMVTCGCNTQFVPMARERLCSKCTGARLDRERQAVMLARRDEIAPVRKVGAGYDEHDLCAVGVAKNVEQTADDVDCGPHEWRGDDTPPAPRTIDAAKHLMHLGWWLLFRDALAVQTIDGLMQFRTRSMRTDGTHSLSEWRVAYDCDFSAMGLRDGDYVPIRPRADERAERKTPGELARVGDVVRYDQRGQGEASGTGRVEYEDTWHGGQHAGARAVAVIGAGWLVRRESIVEIVTPAPLVASGGDITAPGRLK